VDKTKPFRISKGEVWEAYKRVKANQGAAGVDGQSVAKVKLVLTSSWNQPEIPPIRYRDRYGRHNDEDMNE
jgi:hypothetical protein